VRARASSVQNLRTDIQSLAPQYLGPLNRVADLPGRRSLRSTDSNRMVVPSVRLSIVANRAFPVVGPQIWNDLPAEVTSAESLITFRQRLKTHLFFQNHFPATSRTLTNFPGH